MKRLGVCACALASALAVHGATANPGEIQRRDGWLEGSVLDLGAQAPAAEARALFAFNLDGASSERLLAAWPREVEDGARGEGRRQRVLTWRDAKTGLKITCAAVVYADFPAVEWTVHFENEGREPAPILENVQGLDAVFERGPQGEFTLKHYKGDTCAPDLYEPLESTLGPGAALRFAPWGGRGTNGVFPYYNLTMPGGGVFIAVGWPGQWAATFTRDAGRSLRIVAGQELTRLVLRPGERIRTPLTALLFWEGEDLDRAQNLWRRWMIHHNLPRTADGRLPAPIMPGNTSGEFNEMCDAHEENQKYFIDRYLEERIPIDYWWMDAGWYPCNGWPQTGTWEPDLRRFPRGLRAISDHARARGVKTLVWFEPERVAGGTWLAENHPEWLLGGTLLYLGNPEARAWLTGHVDRVLREQGIDLYRQDFNMDPLEFWRRNDAPDRRGMTENLHIQGYLAYWDALRARHPNLVIDSCASGGRRNDLETMRRAVPLHPTDYNYAHLAVKQAFHHSLFKWIPYFGSNTLPVDTVDAYAIRSGRALSVVLGYDLRRGDLDYDLLRKLAVETRLATPYYWGDYYPLAPYCISEDAWIAWQFNRPERGDGIVEAFRRPRSRTETQLLRPRGLEPEAVYEFKDADLDFATRRLGRVLLDEGLPVNLPDRPQAALIFYRRIDGLAAVALAAPACCEAGEVVAFSGEDSRGEARDFVWTFGDGAEGAGRRAAHAYEAPGTYLATLKVTDSRGKHDAAAVAVTVRPADTAGPRILGAGAGTAEKVTVRFDEPVEQASAERAANYRIDPGVRVFSAALAADPRSVVLAVSPLAEGVRYTLAVEGVRDRARQPNAAAPGARATFQRLDLHAWWKLDEGAGDTAFDSSGNGHDAVLTSPAGGAAWAESARGTVVGLDGNGAYIEADTHFPELAMPFSITLWVNPAATQGVYADIFGNHGEPFVGISLQQDGTRTNCYGFGYGDGKRWQGVGPVQLAADKWQHVGIVCDGRAAVFYLDGVQKSRAAVQGPIAPNPAQNFKLGQGYHSGRFFRGCLSDVRLWRRALSPEEAAALAKESAEPPAR